MACGETGLLIAESRLSQEEGCSSLEASIRFRGRCSPESPRTRDRSDSELLAESLYEEDLQVRMTVPAGVFTCLVVFR